MKFHGWRLIMYERWPETYRTLTDKELVDKLIIPENKENYYIRHENPESRYIYAAIFLLLVRQKEKLDPEWDLPKKLNSKLGTNIPFEIWWLEQFEK